MRNTRVAKLKQYSTLYERVNVEEIGFNWFAENNVSEIEHAICGSVLSLIIENCRLLGIFSVSGRALVEGHLFGVKVLINYLAKMGELF